MPSVLSRLQAYLIPQWLLLFLGSYIAYRVALRAWLERAAQASAERARVIKRARMQGETDGALERMQDTQAQRSAGGLEANIVTQSATSIVAKLQTGEYSARLVLHSLLARTIVAQKQFNFISETNFTQALDDADKADKQSAHQTHDRRETAPCKLAVRVQASSYLVRWCVCVF